MINRPLIFSRRYECTSYVCWMPCALTLIIDIETGTYDSFFQLELVDHDPLKGSCSFFSEVSWTTSGN